MYPLMPLPAQIESGLGTLVIDSEFRVGLSGQVEPRLERAAARLTEHLSRVTGIPMSRYLAAINEDACLLIHVDEKTDNVQSATEDESYTLEVNAEAAVLRATKVYGALRGIESFVQLIRLGEDGFGVPAARIADRPRFPWRGLLIDAVRHWIPPSIIKRNLEAMATVKLNVLHWHLTDDQGFRVESYRYPKLHELGSDGLFYSQEEVREIVTFAHDRGIRVLPEFDMPGHAGSWFVGYPNLASAPGPYQIIRDYGGKEATMDPTREEVYEFLSEFLLEMTTLFPDPFFHIGGDEVSGKQWQANPRIRDFMATEGLNDIHHLQAYFNRRLQVILQELDRELIGWDPILHPDLPAGSVVQTVRGQQWLVDATRQGYRAIAGSEYYLTQMRPAESYYTSDPYGGVAGSLAAEQQKLILGGEASMWTELASEENVDSRTWPRAAVIAERLWSPREVTDIDDMYRRLAIVSRRLDSTGVTHNTGPRRMLCRLTNYGPIEHLQTLSEAVQPITSDARKKSRDYTIETPLNRLVDATPPDSESVRQFMRMVEMFLNDRTDEATYDALATQLGVWCDVHDRLQPELKRLSLLIEAEPLSAMLSNVAEIGLLSLRVLHNEGAMSRNEQEGYRVLFKQAATPVAELQLMITPGVQKLVEAIPTD